MRIEADLKLGFKDVLIRPKRSTLGSRAQVSLERTFQFRHTGRTWTGIPIMAANMDTVGTFAMAAALARQRLFTAVHKHVALEEWEAFVTMARETAATSILANVAVSVGILDGDLDKLDHILGTPSRVVVHLPRRGERLFRTVRGADRQGPGAASR